MTFLSRARRLQCRPIAPPPAIDHQLSFLAVSEAEGARGIRAVCVGCGRGFYAAAEWLASPCARADTVAMLQRSARHQVGAPLDLPRATEEHVPGRGRVELPPTDRGWRDQVLRFDGLRLTVDGEPFMAIEVTNRQALAEAILRLTCDEMVPTATEAAAFAGEILGRLALAAGFSLEGQAVRLWLEGWRKTRR